LFNYGMGPHWRCGAEAPRRLKPAFQSARQVGRRDRLSHMPLGMFGYVRHQSYHGGRQTLSSYPSQFGKRVGMDGANHLFGSPQHLADVSQQLREICARLHLRRQRGHLRGIERSPFEISGQAIHAAGNVAKMKTERRQSMRTRPHLAGAQTRRVPRQILARLLEHVERGRDNGIDLRQGPAQPRFRKLAWILRAQLFFSAGLRCRLSGMLSP